MTATETTTTTTTIISCISDNNNDKQVLRESFVGGAFLQSVVFFAAAAAASSSSSSVGWLFVCCTIGFVRIARHRVHWNCIMEWGSTSVLLLPLLWGYGISSSSSFFLSFILLFTFVYASHSIFLFCALMLCALPAFWSFWCLFCFVSFFPPFSCLLVCRNDCFLPVLHTRLALFQSLRPCLFFPSCCWSTHWCQSCSPFFSDLLWTLLCIKRCIHNRLHIWRNSFMEISCSHQNS